jgi:hypothetical protein
MPSIRPKKDKKGASVMGEQRTAEIYQAGAWHKISIEDLHENMVFRLREQGNGLVRDDAGRAIFCALSNPYIDREGNLQIIVRSRMSLHGHGEN